MNDKYLQYNLDDFLNDISFIAYAKNTSYSAEVNWNIWIDNHPDKKDLCSEAKDLILAMQFDVEQLNENQIDSIWKKIESETVDRKSTSDPVRLNVGWGKIAMGLAASVALFFFFNNFWNKGIETNTSFAEYKTINLPDHSTVALNADTKVSYTDKEWNEKRSLTLKGEAFFKVEKGAEFSVYTDLLIVHVLGTSFNVFDRNGIIDVRCETGKVQVFQKIKLDSMMLIPGQGVKLGDNGMLKKYAFKVERYKDWQDGVIKFDRKPLDMVFEELERQFDVRINTKFIDLTRLYTGQFEVDNIENALYGICWPMRLEYTINGKVIHIE